MSETGSRLFCLLLFLSQFDEAVDLKILRLRSEQKETSQLHNDLPMCNDSMNLSCSVPDGPLICTY